MNKVLLPLLILTSFLCLSCPQASGGGGGGGGGEKVRHFYVDENRGDDNYLGTLAQPFKSPQRAVMVIQIINDGKTTYVINLLSNFTYANSHLNTRLAYMQIYEERIPVTIKIVGVDSDGKTPKKQTIDLQMSNFSGLHISGCGKDFTKITLQNVEVTGGRPIKGFYGGGIKIEKSSLTLDKATIKDCAARFGGGISVENGELIMLHGSVVTENSVTRQKHLGGQGGGVYVTGNESVFYMNGGEITKNEADHYGGGVSMNGGSMHMSGGAIGSDSVNTENNNADKAGGGIYLEQNARLFLRGNGVVHNNTKGDNDNNLETWNNSASSSLIIAGALSTTDGYIGVTLLTEEPGAVFAQGINGGHTITPSDLKCFGFDDSTHQNNFELGTDGHIVTVKQKPSP